MSLVAQSPLRQSSLLDLANNVVKQTTILATYLRENDLPEPTFEPNSVGLPESPEYRSLMASLEELQRRVEGPHRSMRSLICQGNDLAAFQVAFEFDFFTMVPLEHDIHVQVLAKQAGIDTDRTLRIFRMLATHHVFQELRPEHFSHTASSALFRQNEGIRLAGQYMLNEMFKAATATATSLRHSPFESDALHSPFNTALGMPLFAYYANNPHYAERFAKAMGGITSVDRQMSELISGFQWDKLKGTVVDVGGCNGHVSIALAHQFPDLNFVVQDQSTKMLEEGESLLTEDISSRVSFMQHDFFKPQPLQNVSAFFIRQCVHNWCDRDVISIFRSLVPGLTGSGVDTPLLINETIMPEPRARLPFEERGLRQMDMLMLIALGSKQRTKTEFETLLKEADPRYELWNSHSVGTMGLLEVRLRKG
ncbi:O-methyltransferase [Hypoxylon sp. NC1633]|nr:O-methyltransferase [Hypoxylon sp. NC1633]